MNKSDLIAIRPYREADKNFIFSTFLRGLYHGGSPFSRMKKQDFMENYHLVIDRLMLSSNTVIKIACLKDKPDNILGYAILTKPSAVTWCFVKIAWRGIGIAKDLVPSNVKTFTTYTKVGLSIANRKKLDFNPFLF